jgi:L-amino acid N-acyltransferase YncA
MVRLLERPAAAGIVAGSARAEAGADQTPADAALGRGSRRRARRVAPRPELALAPHVIELRVDITIRDATTADAEPIARILNSIITAGVYTALDTTFSVEEERAFIERFPARGVFHVAVADGQVAGFQNVEPFATYTRAFDHVGVIGTYVDLELRRRGVGSRLFQATFAKARTRGFEKLWAFVRSDNPAALSAYQRHGFTVIGTARRHARIGGRYIDEVMIELLFEDGMRRP